MLEKILQIQILLFNKRGDDKSSFVCAMYANFNCTPGPSLLGAKEFRFRVSIHHPSG